MRRIILTDDINFVKKLAPATSEDALFFALKDDKNAISIKERLSALGMKAVTRRTMRDRIGEDFKNQFSRAVRAVNSSNDSVVWWAMNFTNKNPILSSLCEDSFCFAAIKQIFSGHKDLDLVVVGGSASLARQLKAWSEKNGIDFMCRIKARVDIDAFSRIYTPIAIGYMFFKLLLRKITSRAVLGGTRYAAGQPVIFSEFDNRSIDGGFYNEIYFKNLKNSLRECCGLNDISFLTLGFSPYFGPIRFYDFCRSLKQKKENADVYPVEHFLPIRFLVKHLFSSLAGFIIPARFRGRFEMFGEDASVLLQNEINKSVGSGQILINLSIHAAVSSFLKRYKPGIIYYPFENRSWEKMVVMACRDQSENTKLVGYQHTIITPKHLCYYLEEGEHAEIPLPDAIITVGEITRDIMRQWNFPADMLRTGCALRMHRDRSQAPVGRRKIQNILTVFTFGVDEYVKMLMFLENAFTGQEGYNMVFRPHPALSMEFAFEVFHPTKLRYRVSTASLREDLEWCDLVIYASSTVSLEAVSIGKPAIFLEIDDFLDSDPMFNMDMLKWRCGDATRLMELMDKIDRMSEEEILGMQKGAAAYTKRYFYPVNRENLAAFLA